MALQGDSRVLSIPDLLSTIQQHKLRGILVVASSTRERSFCFQDGQLVYTICMQPEHLLGNLIMRDLGLDPSLIRELLADESEEGYLGDKLVRREMVTQEQLDGLVIQQIREALHEILGWEEWAFHFQELDEREHLPAFRMSTHAMVFDVSRELDEWESAEQLFEDLSVIPRWFPGHDLGLEKNDDCDDEASDCDEDEAVDDDLDLEPETEPELPTEIEVKDEVDGRRNLREIFEQTTRSVLPLAHAISRCIDEGSVTLHSQPTTTYHLSEDTATEFVLPPIGYRAAELLQALEPGGLRLGEVVFLVASNPVLAARVLRLGALYGVWREGTPIELGRLLQNLNPEALGSTLVAEAVRGLFLAPPCRLANPVIRSSVQASIACHRLAELSNFPDPELARMTALLQDVGRLMMVSHDAETYAEVQKSYQKKNTTLVQAEEEHFETNHCEVGADLAVRWGFPPSVCEALRTHHSPRDALANPLAALLRLANFVTGNGESTSTAFRKKILKDLRLSPRALEEVQRAVQEGTRRIPVTA